MRRWLAHAACCALAGAALLAVAKEAPPIAADPALEARVMQISEELRCLVCQNETIAASQADLAVDLRGQIREKLRAGQTERQIHEYMVARYGDFILYRPPLSLRTLLLWGGPFVLLVAAGAALFLGIRRHRRALLSAALTPEEAQRARMLLAEDRSEP